MKILLVIGSADIGGTEKQIIKLSSKLSNTFDVRLAFLNARGPLLNSELLHLVDWVDLGFDKNKSILSNIHKYIKFVLMLRKEKYNLVHAFLPESILLSWIGVVLSNRQTVMIAGVRGSLLKRNKYINYLYKTCLRKSDFITCNSLYLKKICLEDYGVALDKLTVIPNGIEIATLNPQETEINCRAVVISNLHPYKGILTLLQALKLSNTNLCIDIFGDGVMRATIEKEINRLNLKHQVRLFGHKEIGGNLFDYTFAIHPSETEGFSNAILEELSYGLPVICFNVGGNSELISDRVNGFILNEYSERSLSQALENMVSDSELMLKMKKNAASSVKNFSWEAVCSRYVEFYSKF
jgi:glycosyltransferase involved in cell wall biosynthesis